ncbi:MAG: LytTR family transcriptional regulator DNA-binding domain-containing protein [Bacteroidales bacterium]|nr:LytTR family transcriptional regulator DNA-binding domain-containing protein [Bacteroidales bacterium]
MSQIKIILVEDERPARNLLRTYLEEFPDMEILGEYDNGFDGLKAINELKPDAIFLDVQMPKLTGFELLEVLEHQPEVIFTTAYDQFAIRAFERNAVDYLLKPFSRERFREAITKLNSRLESKRGGVKEESGIEKIKQHFAESDELLHRVVIKKSGKIHVISTSDINFLEAQDDYVMIYTDEGKYLKQQTMKYFEQHLDSQQFVRVHRSYIANITCIERIEPYEKSNFVLILRDGNKVPVSRSGMQVLKENLDF